MIIHVRQRLLRAAKDFMQGKEPDGPFHPEVFSIHRESAIGDTEAEAIAKAKEKAMRKLLAEAPAAMVAGGGGGG